MDESDAFSSIRASVLKRFSKLIKPNVLSSGIGFGAPQKTPDGRLVSVKYWGITRDQLIQLHASCRSLPEWSDADSVNDFVDKFVKPMTKGTGMGVSLLLNQHVPREVNLMISHAWVENTKDFFEDVVSHMDNDEVAFICFLALYQESAEDIQAQLGNDVRHGPFADIISNVRRLSGRMIVVPNECLKENGQGLYSRMWCAWEVYCAAKAKVPIDFTHRRSGEHLLGRGCCSIRNARCGNPALPLNPDEKAIRAAIEEEALDDRIGISGKVQFGAIAWIGCFMIGPGAYFHWAGFLIGLAVFLAVFVLSIRYGTKSDGYDRVDETIERIASGGVRAVGFFRMGSTAMMNVLCLLGILADAAAHISDYEHNVTKRPFAGAAMGGVLGVVLGAAIFLDWGSTLANVAVFLGTFGGIFVGYALSFSTTRLADQGPHMAMSGALIGLSISIGGVYFNRSWMQRWFIMLCSAIGAIVGFMKTTWWSTKMILQPPWLNKKYLGGVCVAAEVPNFKLWKMCFYSMLGLVMGIMATSSSHSRVKRAIRVLTLSGGIVIINLITNADFLFYGGPMLIATLSQRVAIAATRIAHMPTLQQVVLVIVFLVGSSVGALVCNTGGCLIGGVLGNLAGTVIIRLMNSSQSQSSSETSSLAMALCGDVGIEMRSFRW